MRGCAGRAWRPGPGTIGGRRAASLAGGAPFSRDSGVAKGARRIAGGRRRPRDLLFMAATTASRFNAEMAALYAWLVERGKKHKVAIVVVTGKLVALANALLRDGREWRECLPAASPGATRCGKICGKPCIKCPEDEKNFKTPVDSKHEC